MAKEKQQFRELSDEELKQVTGGSSVQEKCSPKASFGGTCPATYTDKGGECCYGLLVGAGAVLGVVAEAALGVVVAEAKER